MKNYFLQKIVGRVYPLLVLEDTVSHSTRTFLKKIFGAVAILLFVASLFVPGDQVLKIKGAFCFFAFWYIWTVLIESYFYAHYESAENQNGKVPFEVARILYYSDDGDLTKGFMFSDIGDEVMKRLEFTENEIKEFLHERNDFVVNIDQVLGNDLNFLTYIKAVYDNDSSLQSFLIKKNIKYSDFENAFVWILKKTEDKIEQERFWSRDRLFRIEGIGKNWSYGETYILEKYGQDITDSGSSHFEGYQSMHSSTVSKLESVLARSHGANAIIISDDEASRMDIVTMFARRIRKGEALGHLSKKRVYVIDSNLLIENSTDKISFERRLTECLFQAMSASNVIIVIPYFSAFLRSAESIGSDALSIIRPFFLSPALHIIALDSKELFQNHLSNNASIMENFEVIQSELSNLKGALYMLEEESEKIERESHFFFSFLALASIVDGAKRYFDAYAFADKARDLLFESVPFCASKGKRRIERADILELIESKTGVPTDAPKAEEKVLLMNLEELLHKRVVGQDEAVKAISDSVRRSRAGVRNPDRPIGSFLFLGPTGVGKTETTKALADIFFGSEEKISRFDMSEFQNSDALAKLIGYFGHDEQGQLTSKLRERPYGVVLLDEFEKTNPAVLDIFLQILDEGQFTDSTGRKINAKNNIFIATSNAGSSLIWDMFKTKQDISLNKEKIINEVIQDGTFKPELLNRFDGIILFHPLGDEHLKKVATFMVEKLVKRMKDKSIIVEPSDDLYKYLISKGTDPKFGARPMNRAIQNELEQLIAEKIISGEIKAGSNVSFILNTSDALEVKIK